MSRTTKRVAFVTFIVVANVVLAIGLSRIGLFPIPLVIGWRPAGLG